MWHTHPPSLGIRVCELRNKQSARFGCLEKRRTLTARNAVARGCDTSDPVIYTFSGHMALLYLYIFFYITPPNKSTTPQYGQYAKQARTVLLTRWFMLLPSVSAGRLISGEVTSLREILCTYKKFCPLRGATMFLLTRTVQTLVCICSKRTLISRV